MLPNWRPTYGSEDIYCAMGNSTPMYTMLSAEMYDKISPHQYGPTWPSSQFIRIAQKDKPTQVALSSMNTNWNFMPIHKERGEVIQTWLIREEGGDSWKPAEIFKPRAGQVQQYDPDNPVRPPNLEDGIPRDPHVRFPNPTELGRLQNALESCRTHWERS